MIVNSFDQFFNVFRRPTRGFHSEMNSHFGQNFFNFVQRLTSEIRCSEHFGFGFLNQVTDVNDVVVFQTVGRTYRQFKFLNHFKEVLNERQFFYFNFGIVLRHVKFNGIFYFYNSSSFSGYTKLINVFKLSLKIRAEKATASSGVTTPLVSTTKVSLS